MAVMAAVDMALLAHLHTLRIVRAACIVMELRLRKPVAAALAPTGLLERFAEPATLSSKPAVRRDMASAATLGAVSRYRFWFKKELVGGAGNAADQQTVNDDLG
jgi:hypothetical protein